MTTHTNRRPGLYARHLARLAAVRALGAFLAALGGALYITRSLPTISLSHPALLRLSALHLSTTDLVVGIITIAFGLLARHEWALRARAAIGARSEVRVAKTLTRIAPRYLANSLLLGAGGDADHTVIGPKFCLVETKTGRGAVSFHAGQMRVGRRLVPGDPLAQARRQAAALHRLTGVACDAVVCVPDTSSEPAVHRGVTVCSLADLAGVIEALPSRMSSEQASAAYEHLVGVDQKNRETVTRPAV